MSLPDDEHHRIFHDRIVPKVFTLAQPSAHPTAVLMGGQPGSGKSGLLTRATEYVAEAGAAAAVQVVGDDLRVYHPHYRHLLTADDRTAAAATDQDSGRWVQMCLEHAREQRYSVVIEGTMRSPRVPIDTAAGFRRAGYRVEAWVMAVDPLSSRLGILTRYHEQRAARGFGRFTVDAAHDAGAAGLLDSVDALQDTGAADRILVATRGPQVIADQPGTARSPRVRDVITAERGRPWSPQEVEAFTARAAGIVAGLPVDHDHRLLVDQLVAAARDRGRGYASHQAFRSAALSFPFSARDARRRPGLSEVQRPSRRSTGSEQARDRGHDR